MQNVRARLQSKGWQKKHIDHAVKTIQSAEKNKHPHMLALDHAVYWASLFVAILANFIISLVMIPLLLTLQPFFLYSVMIIIGFSFGLLFELLITTIEHLETKHHILLTILIPTIAFVNFVAIVLFSNNIGEFFGIQNDHNPVIIAAVYSIVFMIPYLYYNLVLRK